MYLQDVVDVYGMIHNRYIRTPEGMLSILFH